VKSHKFIALIGTVILVLLLTGCASNSSTQNLSYKQTSALDYNNALCESTSYHYQDGGFNTGLRVVLKDKTTGRDLPGSASIAHSLGGGSLSVAGNYSCEEQIASETVVISTYSKGYSPLVFNAQLPKNQLATFEVAMQKSCTGAPSCTDNIRTSLANSRNQTDIDEAVRQAEQTFYDTIERNFGLKKDEYELSCMECNMGRGGYIKAQGTTINGSAFDLYYRWGWCSSGGADCGSEMCFKSTGSSFDTVKEKICSGLTSSQRNDGMLCTNPAYNTTTIIQAKCKEGIYEENNSIALRQLSNRCGSSVDSGTYNCLEN
jgi:hypothetical protein